MQPFSLTKWYVDCVDSSGRVAIAYWSAIAWGGLAITWHSLSLCEPGAEPVHASSIASVDAPTVTDQRILWQSSPLSVRLDCRRSQPPVGLRLLETAEGHLDWCCEAAAGQVALVVGDRQTWHGPGYAEHIEMTIPPWRLPIDQLQWGRWIASGGHHSVVWIDWRGPQPLTKVFRDGGDQADARVAGDRIDAGDTVLTLTEPHTIYSRSLANTLGGLQTVLAPLLPASWLALEDRKWLSRGLRRTAGRDDEAGWAIHETLGWPS